MITPQDFLHLPYTNDLTLAGIAYACRSLGYTYDRMGGDGFERMRRIVSGKAVELAFLRRLQAQRVLHDMKGVTPFTEPDRYDIALRNRRCDIKSYLIYHKNRISQVRHHPEILLEAEALVPEDQALSEALADQDLYIFAFISALLTRSQAEVQKALAADQPSFLISLLPPTWSQPRSWKSLGKLKLKSGCSQAIHIELGGLSAQREFQTEGLALAPSKAAPIASEFFSVSYLHALELPDGPTGIHSSNLNETCLVNGSDWQNIWIYGMDIVLVGYISHGEFRRRARRLPAGSRVFQYSHTRTPNLAIPVDHLYPITDLLTG